ncbi:MAG: hypothetical protein QME76_07180 [Bacillota bacterium]|nr:hypothetical protein [Bacillota bacterium]
MARARRDTAILLIPLTVAAAVATTAAVSGLTGEAPLYTGGVVAGGTLVAILFALIWRRRFLRRLGADLVDLAVVGEDDGEDLLIEFRALLERAAMRRERWAADRSATVEGLTKAREDVSCALQRIEELLRGLETPPTPGSVGETKGEKAIA